MVENVILVTGGSRGLGAKFVERLAADNKNRIYFTFSHSSEKATQLEAACTNTTAVKCNQLNEDQIKSCISKIHSEQGKLDVLINNACPAFQPQDLLAADWDLFQNIMDVNVKGAYFFIREAASIMKNQGHGKIINILSSYVLGVPPEKIAFYITAKYALLGLSKAAAVELAKYGITVNMLSPGLMSTDLSAYLPRKYMEMYSSKHPMKRMTTTDDAADVLEFLISGNAQFLNGVNIPVNGGELF